MEPSLIKSVGSSVPDELGSRAAGSYVCGPSQWWTVGFSVPAGCRPLQQTLSVRRAPWREAKSRRFLPLLLPHLLGCLHAWEQFSCSFLLLEVLEPLREDEFEPQVGMRVASWL